jgi:3',5'-cyclic AMP phosphodiesterase CpdA
MNAPLRLWVWSDLHQEWGENAWDPAAHAPVGGFDVAVVAGDVHVPLTRSLNWLAERLPGVPVVYVPGNHDFWWDRGEERYTIHDQLERGRERAAALGIHLLLDNAMVVGGTRFLGGVLWTDFRLGNYGLTHAFRSAQGRFGMVDYRRIRTGPRSRNRIEPGEVLAMHRATRAFIEAELAQHPDGPTVVVTHHAPHPDSLPSPHVDLSWCYASDLIEMILEHGPDLWVHGHVHQSADYVLGRTRVLCNPSGHADERTGFVPDLCVELD